MHNDPGAGDQVLSQRDWAPLTSGNAEGRSLSNTPRWHHASTACGAPGMPGAAQATPTPLKHTVHCMQDVHSDMEMLHAARGTDKPDQRCEGKRSAAECAAKTQRALAEIGARSRNHLFCGSQQRALDSIVSEFEVYVAELNCPGRDTWATCTYIEVLVFLQAHYLPSHRGNVDGNVVLSTLRKAISRLKRAFTMRGRVGAWQELPGGGRIRRQSLRAHRYRGLCDGVRQRGQTTPTCTRRAPHR